MPDALPLLPRRRTGVYTAQFVQECGTATQHRCCHGEHGFRCLHRRGNRDLLNRYTLVTEGDDDSDDVACCMLSKVETKHVVFIQKRFLPAQEVIYTSTVSQTTDEGSYCDLTGVPLQFPLGSFGR